MRMKEKIVILPGTPNDDNRDYLPEAIKGSDMVVNENGNNSQVYPERLTEYTDTVADGVEDTWYEYVPASYDGSEKVPLVVSMHGGLMTGWGQAIYTSWTLVADREGFICLFPNAHQNRLWTLEADKKVKELSDEVGTFDGFFPPEPPKTPEENHDLNCALALIERMKQKYNIDEGRIFMQGMSMGNVMTTQFARYYGQVLAGQAGGAGPTYLGVFFDENGDVINRGGPLAVWQTRVEHDVVPPFFGDDTDTVVKKNREYWKRINQCDSLPDIKIIGEDNFAFYRGEMADLVFRDVKNRDHGQTFDDAELVWDYLFSGVKRDESGRIVHSETIAPRKGDEYAIALATGSAKAYVNNELMEMSGPVFTHQKLKYHGLNGDSIVRLEYFMASVSFVAEVFAATTTTSADGLSVEMTLPDGRVLQFARGSIGCVVDNHIHSMFCEAVYRDGEFYIPIEWVCQRLFNNHVSNCDGVLYITDHYAELSVNMAHIIRDEILV